MEKFINMNSSCFIQEIKLTITSDSKPTLEELRANAYGDLGQLLTAGVFSFKNGVAEIHRDSEGKLRGVSIKEHTFKG